ncbi:TPA: hypothetical protein DEG21_02220 [Patescibacteria group bacterium]|nr:hypothetical protein [Candidatus Gracilibacteria bacterium]
MNTTTNTAVENNKNFFSSFFNSCWKSGHRFTTILSIILITICAVVAWYGLKQPYNYKVIIPSFMCIVLVTVFIEGIWRGKKPFLIVTIFFTWYAFSNQLTTTKIGDVDMEMYSKKDWKLAKKSVFIPLFFSSMDEEYFAVMKLAPRKIAVKVTIPDDPKSSWRGEQKLDKEIFVELQPLNYEARKKILGSGLWQVEVETTSKADAPEAIKIDVLKQLSLKPSDVNIKVSEI